MNIDYGLFKLRIMTYNKLLKLFECNGMLYKNIL